jgi:hypothetical protein
MQHSHPNVFSQPHRMGHSITPPHILPHSSSSHSEPHLQPATLTPKSPNSNPITTAPNALPKQRHHSLSSSSEEMDVIHHAGNNHWQLISRTNRKRLLHPQPTVQIPQTEIRNRYHMLTDEDRHADLDDQPHSPTIHKPPPIFIHGVINYDEMIKSINEVAEVEQFRTKSMANNVIKLTCTTPDTYRSLIKHFKDKDLYYHTHQLKGERAYRVVLKYLHHTTVVEDIRQELFALRHVVRNIVNVRHRLTKEPLKLFFVDLEPAKKNKDIYNLTDIQNKIIHVEPTRTNNIHIPQCTRCQHYGHTRSYCNKSCACVKCVGPHNSADCTKRRDTPAKCALCSGNHPANYNGCECYHSILRGTNPHRTPHSAPRHYPLPHIAKPHLPITLNNNNNTSNHNNNNNNAVTLT